MKLHHVLADGPAAMAAFGALLDQTADAPDQSAPPWTPAPSPSSSELLRDNLRRRRQELGRGCSGLVHPSRTLRLARRTLPAWREVLTEKPAPRTSLNHPVGPERQLAIVRGRLDPAKRVAHLHHATVNDVVLAAIAGGPMGNLTLVAAALSYACQLNLIAAADRDSCPDVEVFTHGVCAALDDLARSAFASTT